MAGRSPKERHTTFPVKYLSTSGTVVEEEANYQAYL